jgi:hypothetical protein
MCFDIKSDLRKTVAAATPDAGLEARRAPTVVTVLLPC